MKPHLIRQHMACVNGGLKMHKNRRFENVLYPKGVTSAEEVMPQLFMFQFDPSSDSFFPR
jgi:hypothetical protein